MTKADAMFEKLGYAKDIDVDYGLIRYNKDDKCFIRFMMDTEELEKNKNKLDEINETTRLYSPYDTYDFQINILKELLGDE